ncbi:hypothetical protein EDC04DRAFT_2899768 [Pisolithus marmoratus]|nr:hypothetical protein EDC04DRAFT_2899768 [Pisolithus marmoratus]
MTGLLQDDEMLVVHEEMPVIRKSPQLKLYLKKLQKQQWMMPWLHALDKCIEQLEEIVKMNKAKVAEMHEDLARFMAWVLRFRSAVLEQ